MRMPRSILLPALASFACALAIGACSDSTGPNVVGLYDLRTVNGTSLPVTLVQIGEDKLEITAGTLNLMSFDSFGTLFTFRYTEDGVATYEAESANGTYTRNNGALEFTETETGVTVTGTLAGDTIRFIDEEVVFVFTKIDYKWGK